jgi:hypothetical protein
MEKNLLIIDRITFLYAACAKEELIYSYEPDVNDWVVENKHQYANIAREELTTFDWDKQLGLFRSFSPDQKLYLYQAKYRYLMGLESLSLAEKIHLSKLYDFATPEIYVSKEEKQRFNLFWLDEAGDVFGWEAKDIFLYTHTYVTIEEFDKIETTTKAALKLKSAGKEEDCKCKHDIGCPWRPISYCEKGNCIVMDGCGPLSMYQCDELCV